MFDLNAVKTLKNTSENKEAGYENLLKEAIKAFDLYSDERDDNILRKAARLFLEAIKANRSFAEPYIYLSYIFYLFEEDKLAADYYFAAEKLDPHYPKLGSLKALIN